MSLREYVRLLHYGRWWISGGLVLGALIGLVVTVTSTPTYTATTTLYLAAIEGGGEPGQAYQGSLLAEQKAPAYADLFSSDRMHDEVARLLEEDVPPGSITAVATAGSPVVTVQAHAATPDGAQRIAQVTADEAARLVAELERPLDPLLSTVLNLRMVSPPELPSAPSAPNALSDIGLGVVLGAVAGLAVTLGRRNLDRTVRSRESVEAATGAQVLAVVPRVGRRFSRTMMSADPDGAFADSFRRLRTNLAFRVGDNYRSVLVTEPSDGDGRTTVACNLAAALGLEGRRVLLVDADLRGHAASRYLNTRSATGLTGVLKGEQKAEQVIERSEDGLFEFLPSGPQPRHPSELLGSDRTRKLLAELEHRYDIVVVDAPGVLTVVDAAVLSPLIQTTLVVAHYGRTREPDFQEAVAMLREAGATIAGGVLLALPVSRLAAWRRRRTIRRGPLDGRDVLPPPYDLQESELTPSDGNSASPATEMAEVAAPSEPVEPTEATTSGPPEVDSPIPTPRPTA